MRLTMGFKKILKGGVLTILKKQLHFECVVAPSEVFKNYQSPSE